MNSQPAKYFEYVKGERRASVCDAHICACLENNRPLIELAISADHRTAVVYWSFDTLTPHRLRREWDEVQVSNLSEAQLSLLTLYTRTSSDFTPFSSLGISGHIDCLTLPAARIVAGLIHDLFLLVIEVGRYE